GRPMMKRKTALWAGIFVTALLLAFAAWPRNESGSLPPGWATREGPLEGRWIVVKKLGDVPDPFNDPALTIQGNTASYTDGRGHPGYAYVIDQLDTAHDPPWIDWTAFDVGWSGQRVAFR